MRSAAMYILHWPRIWSSVSSVSGLRPVANFMPFVVQPLAHALRFLVAHLLHLGEQRRLAEPLLEDARRVQQFVGDDGVVHAHAALVENSHDRLVAAQILRQPCPQLRGLRRNLELAERMHVARSCVTVSPASHLRNPARKNSSVKSSLHSVL